MRRTDVWIVFASIVACAVLMAQPKTRRYVIFERGREVIEIYADGATTGPGWASFYRSGTMVARFNTASDLAWKEVPR